MKQTSGFQTMGALCVLLVMCMAATLSHGAVTATPDRVTFTSPDQSATIALSSDGSPVLALDVRGWRFLVNNHDYQHMILVEKKDGAIMIRPSAALEVGSYDLSIDTAHGPVTVRVYAPLSDLPDVVEKTAALTGMSEKRVEERLGLTTSLRPEETLIELPPVYYEGQSMDVHMPLEPGRAGAWFVNGELVAEGSENNALAYTFNEPGEYVLIYMETENRDGQTLAVGRARAYTRVVPVPSVTVETAVNTEMEYLPPAGYQNHLWRLDGEQVSTEPTLKHVFIVPGTYIVECQASSPHQGRSEEFVRVRYHTVVTLK
jgi:hypothetical protein